MRGYITFFTFFTLFSIQAQHLEIGVKAGLSNYLGDLTPSTLWVSFGDTRPHFGCFARYNLIDWITIRGGFNYGKIAASDARSVNEIRKQRNISFRSDIFEIELVTEINILGYQPYRLRKRFSPYVFAGLAFFRFNPQAELNGIWYDLQPLGTEGQGLPGQPSKYHLSQFAIPAGLGLKFALTKNWNIGAEFGMRKTYTDYLDDISSTYPNLDLLGEVNGALASELSWRTDELGLDIPPPGEGRNRGDPEDLDWYIFSGVFVSFNFIGTEHLKSKGKRTKIKCPFNNF